ncbi:MAG TPA: hypothetical protein VGN17_09350 [Bryobacteraceae bacterium]|jgi:hypothetical protein
MAAAFTDVFAALKPVLTKHGTRLAVKTDTATKYAVVGKTASPFPQHKGHPLEFGSVVVGKAYVSLHLMPIYMNEPLQASISAELKKRMQGKSCFNFKTVPEPVLVDELNRLTEAAFQQWNEKKWL